MASWRALAYSLSYLKEHGVNTQEEPYLASSFLAFTSYDHVCFLLVLFLEEGYYWTRPDPTLMLPFVFLYSHVPQWRFPQNSCMGWNSVWWSFLSQYHSTSSKLLFLLESTEVCNSSSVLKYVLCGYFTHETSVQNSKSMWRAAAVVRIQWLKAFHRVHSWTAGGARVGHLDTAAPTLLSDSSWRAVSECLAWTCSEVKCWFPSTPHSLVWHLALKTWDLE